MGLFRIHLRPKGGKACTSQTVRYCLDHSLLGVGWRVQALASTLDWEAYQAKAKTHYDNVHQCQYIKDNIGQDDLVWTRDEKADYYLAKVRSGWEYFVSEESHKKDIDIANIFRVDFQKVPIDFVPGKVVACFRAPRTLQCIKDKEALLYSKALWNKLSDERYYLVDSPSANNIFMMLDDKETEDLLLIYLQMQGWCFIPSSRRYDTIYFEYLLVHKQSKKKARVQVKTGNSRLNRQDYLGFDEIIFLFQSNALYDGVGDTNIICISPLDILSFLKKELAWLPGVFKVKFEGAGINS